MTLRDRPSQTIKSGSGAGTSLGLTPEGVAHRPTGLEAGPMEYEPPGPVSVPGTGLPAGGPPIAPPSGYPLGLPS